LLTGLRGMQECFRAHPDVYGAELEDDEEEDESDPVVKDGKDAEPTKGETAIAKVDAPSTAASEADTVESAVDSAKATAKDVAAKVPDKVTEKVGEVKAITEKIETPAGGR
jgi:hypothetical protein